jgi:hypothetical protein
MSFPSLVAIRVVYTFMQQGRTEPVSETHPFQFQFQLLTRSHAVSAPPARETPPHTNAPFLHALESPLSSSPPPLRPPGPPPYPSVPPAVPHLLSPDATPAPPRAVLPGSRVCSQGNPTANSGARDGEGACVLACGEHGGGGGRTGGRD